MRILLATLLILVAVSLIGACESSSRSDGSSADGDGDSDVDGDSDGDSDSDSDADQGCDMMDILFIVDDSGSMGCEQDTLELAFPQFVNVLETFTSSSADPVTYRIGVTATSKTMSYTIDIPPVGPIDPPPIPFSENGLDGVLVQPSGAPNPWIDGPGDISTITSQFSDAAVIGTGGTSYEMPLEMMRTALDLDATGQPNEGFLRDNSLFIAVVITDEDDCSRSDVGFTIPDDRCMDDPVEHNLNDLADYKSYLDTRFNGSDRYVFVTIAGADFCDGSDYMVTCEGDDDTSDGANEATRLMDFTYNHIGTGDGNNGVFADICTSNLSDALSEALDKMEVACDEYPVIE